MVTYSPRCTYEIRSFKCQILFWEKTFYVIVKIDPWSSSARYKTEFFVASNIEYDTICWHDFEHATKYWSYKGAKRHLNKILGSGNSSKLENNLTLEYSTNGGDSIILEDPLEQKFKLLEE